MCSVMTTMGNRKILLWDLYSFQKDFHLRDLEEEDLEAVLEKAEEAFQQYLYVVFIKSKYQFNFFFFPSSPLIIVIDKHALVVTVFLLIL